MSVQTINSHWFINRRGLLTYSMLDAVTEQMGAGWLPAQALKKQGSRPSLLSTGYAWTVLANNGLSKSINESWIAPNGVELVLWAGRWYVSSGGAGGHVGVMIDDTYFILRLLTQGATGQAINTYPNDYYGLNKNQTIDRGLRMLIAASNQQTKQTQLRQKIGLSPSFQWG